jgi:hypothetical protein
VFVDVVTVNVVKVTVVEEVRVSVVLDRLVTAARAVGVRMRVVRLVFVAHWVGSWSFYVLTASEI